MTEPSAATHLAPAAATPARDLTPDAAAPGGYGALALLRRLDAVPPRVVLALVLTALVSMVVLGISEFAFTEIEAGGRAARQVSDAQALVKSLQGELLQAESSQRGYLITADERYLRPFEGAIERSRRMLGELQRLAALLPTLRAPLATLAPLIDDKIDEMRLSVRYTQQGNRLDAVQMVVSNRGIGAMESIEAEAGRLMDDLGRLADQRTEEVNRVFLLQRIGVGLLVLLNLAFLAFLGVRTVRSFYEREQHRAELARQAQELERQVNERTEELSSLSTYLQASTEREKGRLARDLHDELGGILTAAKIDASWLEGFAAGQEPDVQQRMRRLTASLDEAVEVKRRVIENLRPSLLDHLGLAAAVEWHVQEICGNAGLACEVFVPEEMGPIPPEVSIAVYRIVQESLTNVVKYAQARRVTVELNATPEQLELRVRDDGIGIANFEPQHLTHGIAGMRQRARSMGGSFSLTTGPGQGTLVVATVPLPRERALPASSIAALAAEPSSTPEAV